VFTVVFITGDPSFVEGLFLLVVSCCLLVVGGALPTTNNQQLTTFYTFAPIYIGINLNTMSLEEKINADLKAAMLAKEEAAVRGIRAIKSALLLAKTSGGGSVSPEDELKMLQKLVKQRKESVDIYTQQNREDLAKTELEEVAVIERYLPKQLSEEEIRSDLQKIIADSGAKGPQELGKVMGLASKHFAGRADNKLVSQLVKQLLGA
jgi:uncharacterized protein